MTIKEVLRWSLATALVALIIAPGAATAEDLIVIPVSGFARGEEGDVLTIATVDVPSDVVGSTCQITGATVNQVSVHDGNDLLIITGGQTFVVPNFEDAGFIVHEAGETAAIGSTVQLQIRFGPDGVSSGGFRVSVDCEPTDTPPSTAPPTTAVSTTAVSTTVTPTSVDADPPTTTEEPPAGPTASTTTPPTTTPPTTTPPTTASTTAAVPPAGPSAESEGSLPVTGSSTGLILGFGTVIVAAGLVMRRVGSPQM